VSVWFTHPQTYNRDHRAIVAALSGVIVTYCVTVLWYVATFPDVGLRCLLPNGARPAGVVETRQDSDSGIEIWEWIRATDGDYQPAPKAGDTLIRLNGRKTATFLDFISALQSLRSGKIPVGGQLAPGSDPSELKHVPPLVEVYDPVHSQRLVEVIFRRPASERPDLQHRVYLPVRPVSVAEVSLTIFWFVCQLSILAIALTSYWYRPFDRVARNFCLMCCAAMGAFVPGFHWWVMAGNPVLNIPFILCASLLPSLVLNFFLVFPNESEFVRRHRIPLLSSIFGLAGVICLSLVVIYWTAWALNGTGDLNVFQRLSILAQMALHGTASSLNTVANATRLLMLLRSVVHLAIVVASLYFLATVIRLAFSLMRLDSPRERRQVVTILVAALLSTVPISYSLYLAFFRKVDFALGQAQIPMFIASMLFMAAYSHGIFRHRLMLAEEAEDKGRTYILMSLLVSGGFATILATGGMFAHSYSLPLNSSTTQQISLFFILLLATGLSLWVRDRLQAAVDRRFFSEKYQLDRAMQQLNRSAAYLAEPTGMADITLKTCEDVIDASWAIMYARDGQGVFRLIGTRATSTAPAQLKTEQLNLHESGETVIHRIPSANRDVMSPVQQLLHDLRAELLCLMEGEGGIHGVIILGRRRGGTIYSAEDIAFLHAIGQMSVLALHSSRANQAMARLDAELEIKMDRIAEQQRQMAALRAELISLQTDAGQTPSSGPDPEFDREGVRGNSPALLEILGQVRKVARSQSTVLIRGESGTGKELLARVIHRNSERANAPLVCVNCAALSTSLLESELFGHVKGAFTGAHADKPGRFQAADGGTLFLDEIGDISGEIQVKLLRVLQERCFEPVGSDTTVQVDVRLIAATNRNLEEMIARGQFRADLFYRLNVVALTLPPLRERPDDLAELVFYFLSRSAQKSRKPIRQIHPDALAALEAHAWPGNIRELENVMERAVVLADSDIITLEDLPLDVQGLSGNSTSLSRAARQRSKNPPTTPALPIRTSARKVVDANSEFPPTAMSNDLDEEAQLREALRLADGNKAVAARRLNLPRSTFFSKCKKYGITTTADA